MSMMKLRTLIGDVKMAMFTTIDSEGMLRSRPLATLDADGEEEGEAELWFFTSVESTKVAEIEHEREVSLAYSDPVHQRYVSVSGTATISLDRLRIKRLWKPVCRAWFPEGVDDPDLVLIHVRIIQAEYWDVPEGAVANAIGIIKAIVGVERYEPGENRKVRLRAT